MDCTEIFIKNCSSGGVGQDRFGARYLMSGETKMIAKIEQNCLEIWL